MRWFLRALLIVLLAIAAPAMAAAVTQVRFQLSFFYPPNPCTDSGYRDATLEGIAALSFQHSRAGDPIAVGSRAAPALACGESAVFDVGFELPGDGALFFSFAGELVDSTSTHPLFAFPVGEAASAPPTAPLIELGSFSGGGFIGAGGSEWPLLVFASPGQRIGTVGVRVIPEPGSAALLAAALLAALSYRRRHRPNEPDR